MISKFKRLKRKQSKTDEVLQNYEFMQSDESSQSSEEDDLGDFIVEDDDDTGRDALRSEGVLIDTNASLARAFNLLRSSEIDKFLETDIIQRTFAPAYHLLASFGHGTPILRKIWRVKWNGLVSFKTCDPMEGTCDACGRQRVLRYKIMSWNSGHYQTISSGPDCFEIKIEPLFDLVSFCLDNIDSDIETIVKGLCRVLDIIRAAPAKMVELYSN